MATVLRDLHLEEISLVDRPANPHARVMLHKAMGDDTDPMCSVCGASVDGGANFCPNCGAPAPPPDGLEQCRLCGEEVEQGDQYCSGCGVRFWKAQLTAEERDSLPDSDFAAVWTDADGKKQRALPIQDAAHVRAALGGHGLSATKGIPAEVKAKAKKKIAAAAKKFGIGEDDAKKGLLKAACASCGDPVMHKNAAFCPGCGAKLSKSEDSMAKEEVDLSKLEPAVKAHIEKLEADLKAATAKAEPEDVFKGLSPEARARVEKLEAESKASRDRVEKLEDERLTEQFTKRAEALPNVGTDRGKVAKLLKVASQKLEKADFEELETMLKAANEQIEKGQLFATHGSGGGRTPTGDTAYAVAKEKAKALVEKKEVSTIEKGVQVIFEREPELYNRHLAESRAN
jgi:hypothetical protein